MNISEIYDNGTPMGEWLAKNHPDPDLIYRSGQGSQMVRIEGLAKVLQLKHEPRVVESHRSKSVVLPVTCLRLFPYEQVSTHCFIRDNFYDIKLCVVSDGPVEIPYSLVFDQWTEETLKDNQERYINYGREEERAKRKAQTEASNDWYHQDWSSGKLFRDENDNLWRGDQPLSCYCEGIERLPLPKTVYRIYQQGMKEFGISLRNYAQLAMVVQHLQWSLEKHRRVWLDEGGREQLKAAGKL